MNTPRAANAREPMTVALAIGDPNGIGPEIAVKAAAAFAARPDAPSATRSSGRSSARTADGPLHEIDRPHDARLVLFGDAFAISWYAQRCCAAMTVRVVRAEALPPAEPDVIDVVDIDGIAPLAFSPGDISASAGAATLIYAAAALEAARIGCVDAVIACPHSETAIHASGARFTGYPGFVAEQMGVSPDEVYLLLIGGGLRIVHATLHEGIASAIARLDRGRVEGAARAAAHALQAMGIARPVIGIMGINPHAGENGLFGHEDIDITEPAAHALREQGFAVVGPQGADLLLANTRVDVFVAMYHDQGHIPIKLRAGRCSAALTVGAGVLFSSVGHGSGFDIAGALRADPAPLMGAIRVVARGVAHAMPPDEVLRNALPR